MSDNVVANPGVGGATFAADDVGGIMYPRSKLVWGADGTATDASAAAPLPVVQTGALAVSGSGTFTVDGSAVTQPVSLASVPSHAVTNAGTFAVQATLAAGAAAIAKAEDTASADADVGIPAMAVRKATPANTSGTDGDYEFLQMSTGRLWASATIDAALPAGANAIGKLAANSGVDIGDVDVTTVGTITPGTAASSLGKAEDAAHADGDVGVMSLAVRKNTAASTSGTDGDYQPLITNTTGHLWVDASGQALTVGSHAVTNAGTFAVQATEADGANTTLGAKADAKSTATDTTAVTAMQVLKQISASVQAPPSQAVTNAGTFAAQAAITAASGSIGSGAVASGAIASGAVASGAFASGAIADGAQVTLGSKADAKSTATDTTSITAMSVLKQISASVQAPPSQAVTNAGTFVVQENGTQVQVDDAAFTPATSKIVMAGFEADETATDSVDEGDGGAARMTLDRKQIVNVQPHTAGGLSTFMASGSDGSSILTNAAQAIKASAGQIYGYYIYNPNAAATFVHFYNTAAASVTVGTTNPLFTLTIPATSAANLMGAIGILFTNAGFSMAATTTAGGNTAPATGLDAVVWYL